MATTRRTAEIEDSDTPVESRIEALIERGKEAVAEQRDHAEEALDQARRYIKKNPAQAVLIAAGVGFVLGALWNRRSN